MNGVSIQLQKRRSFRRGKKQREKAWLFYFLQPDTVGIRTSFIARVCTPPPPGGFPHNNCTLRQLDPVEFIGVGVLICVIGGVVSVEQAVNTTYAPLHTSW